MKQTKKIVLIIISVLSVTSAICSMNICRRLDNTDQQSTKHIEQKNYSKTVNLENGYKAILRDHRLYLVNPEQEKKYICSQVTDVTKSEDNSLIVARNGHIYKYEY